jgi:hypothetical protein
MACRRILLQMALFLVPVQSWDESLAVKIKYPPAWTLVTELPLLIHVDASDFYDVWLNDGMTLLFVLADSTHEVDTWNTTYRVEGPL